MEAKQGSHLWLTEILLQVASVSGFQNHIMWRLRSLRGPLNALKVNGSWTLRLAKWQRFKKAQQAIEHIAE